MVDRVVPMIHVPDVRATVVWYESIGFAVVDTYGNQGDGLSFAILSFGASQIMFNQGGQPSDRHRREVDLYIYSDNIDELYERLKDRVDVEAGPHDTFYGMREFIIRDLNRFWITFGQASAFERLMSGIREGDAETVRAAIEKGGHKAEVLSAALVLASSSDTPNAEIRELLEQAGAVAPVEVSVQTLQSYVGKYSGGPGIELNVSLVGNKLCAAPGSQPPLRLMAIDQTTFKPIDLDNYGSLTFFVEDGVTTSCALNHGDGGTIQLKRVNEAE